jgi:hypothetical protein
MEFLGLSFSLGLKFQVDIDAKLGLSVTRPGFNLSVFSLVATFGHSKFYPFPDNVGVLLQAAIGGSAAQFKVSQLGERTFKFVVSAKPVGFFINNLRSLFCDSFKVFFFL